MSLEDQVSSKIETGRRNANPLRVSAEAEQLETHAIEGFIKGTYDLGKLKELMGAVIPPAGRVCFDTLPEFIVAVRSVIKEKEEQDMVLDHENAHAVEALQRGYPIRYSLEFTRDEKRFLILKITRQQLESAGVTPDFSNKNGVEPEEQHLREDLIAILSAPENMTDGTMSDVDSKMLGGTKGE